MATFLDQISGDAETSDEGLIESLVGRNFKPSILPPLEPIPYKGSKPTTRNPIVAGVSSGIDQIEGLGGSFVAGIGQLLGAKTLRDWGAGVAARKNQDAAENGREDLNKPLWETGLTDIPSWIAYRTAQQVPQMALQYVGGKGVGALRGMTRFAGTPKVMEALGEKVPQVLGGGRGMAAAEAAEQGAKWGKSVTDMAIAGYPLSMGSMFGEALEREASGGDEAGFGDAAKAALLAPAYAALDAMEPRALEHMLMKGQKGKLATRMISGMLAGQAAEAPQEALQTAMEMTFRPDLSMMDKFKSVLDAAVTGGVVGGALGGMAGIRRAQTPSEITNQDIKDDLDEKLGIASTSDQFKLSSPGEAEAAPASTAARLFAGRDTAQLIAKQQELETKIAAVTAQDAAGEVDPAKKATRPTAQDDQMLRRVRDEIARRASLGNDPAALAETQRQQALIAEQQAQPNNGMGVMKQVVARQQEQAVEQQTERATQAAEVATQGKRPLAAVPDTELTRVIDVAERKGSKANESERLVAFRAREELTARSAENVRSKAASTESTAPEAQQTLPGIEKHEAEQKQISAFYNQIAEMGGSKKPPRALAGAKTLLDAHVAVASRLNEGNPSGWFMKAGQSIGLIDEKGVDQTPEMLQAKIAKAKETLNKVYGEAQVDPKATTQKKVEAVRNSIRMLTAQFNNVQNVQRELTIREREANPTPMPKGDALMKNADGVMQPVKVLAAKPIQINGQPHQPVRDANGARRNVPVKALHPSAPVEEVQSSSPVVEASGAQTPQFAETEPFASAPNLPGEAWLSERSPFDDASPLFGQDRRAAIAKPPTVFGRAAPLPQQPTIALAPPTENTPTHASYIKTNMMGSENVESGVIDELAASDARRLRASEIARRMNAIEATRALNADELRMAISALTEIKNEQKFVTHDRVFAGPFLGSTSNVVMTDSVPQRFGDVLGDVLRAIGLRDMKIVLASGQDIADLESAKRYGIVGGFADGTDEMSIATTGAPIVNLFGLAGAPGRRNGMIVLDFSQGEARALEALFHEVGHLIHFTVFKAAPKRTREAVFAAYNKWYREHKNDSIATLLENTRAPVTSELYKQDIIQFGVRSDGHAYLASFSEWFADQTARWSTTSEQPRTMVEKFFADVVQQIKKFISYMSANRYMPDQTVREYLDSLMKEPPQLKTVQALLEEIEAPEPSPMPKWEDRVTVADVNARAKQFMDSANIVRQAVENMPVSEIRTTGQKWAMAWSTLRHLVQFWGGSTNGFRQGVLERVEDLHTRHRAMQVKLASVMAEGYNSLEGLRSKNRKGHDNTLQLMAYTALKIDPRKTWDKHAHLHGAKNRAELEAAHADARKLWNDAVRDGYNGVYESLVKGNEFSLYASDAATLWQVIDADQALSPEFKATLQDPIQEFMGRDEVNSSLDAARTFMRDARDKLRAAVTDHLANNTTYVGAGGKVGEATFQQSVKDLTATVNATLEHDRVIQAYPNFHLGRSGKYQASFQMKTEEDGSVSDDTLRQISDIIAAAKFDVVIPPTSQVNRAFFRFETLDEANRFENIMHTMERRGLLVRDKQEPKVSQQVDAVVYSTPPHLQGLAAHIKDHFKTLFDTDAIPDDRKAEMREFMKHAVASVDQYVKNLLPETSLLRVSTRRQNVPGFAKNMGRSYAFRSSVFAEALAGQYFQPLLTDAMQNIKSDVDGAKVLGATTPENRYTMSNLYMELLKRESNRATIANNEFYDTLKALNHNYFLGPSVAYPIIQMMQIPTFLWPTLAKKNGFVKSFSAIKAVTPAAMRIMRAVIADGASRGFSQMLDATITAKVLDKLNLTKDQRDFLLRMSTQGVFDMGSQSRELARVADGRQGSKTEFTMRAAASFGYYSEMTTRLIAALAAYELNKGLPSEKTDRVALDTVTDSMFQFSTFNVARMVGKHGFLGQFTPVAMAFNNYVHMVIETLIRETHAGFIASAKTAEQKEMKAQSRRFLAGHLTAVGVLSGTMGLPMFSLIAATINGLADLFGDDDDEPYDVATAYQKFLSDTLGPEMGRVVAKGMPRALGFDIHTRVGEQDMFPLARFLSDRRSWAEASTDYTSKMAGAPTSMIINILSGVGSMLDGNIVDGMAQGLPIFMRNMAKTFRMTRDGYVDKAGNKQPVQPDVLDRMYQLIGFAPANLANLNERYYAYQGQHGRVVERTARLRKEFAKALESGEDTTDELKAIQRWDASNPAYSILPTLGSYLSTRVQKRALANQGATPLGVPRKLQDAYSW